MSPTEDPRLCVDQVAVRTAGSVDADVPVLGSKSYTNRYLAMASFAEEQTVIDRALLSDDTVFLARGIESFGHVEVDIDHGAERIVVRPTGRRMRAPDDEIYIGGAGTPIRFLIAMAGHAEGVTVLNGNARMRERPMGDLLAALPALGVSATAVRENGSPPIRVTGGSFAGGRTSISGRISSQFTSSLIINAVPAPNDTEITVSDELISQPYVDMTLAALAERGVTVEREGYRRFTVRAGQRPRGGSVAVEPDASGMSYFLAAAAVLGGRVTIPGIGAGSCQGDVGLVGALERMGCQTATAQDSVTVKGAALHGIDVDMEAMPDVVPTLAVVAAFAEGVTRITNIASLRIKECDRIAAVTTELRKMGVTVEEFPDAMHITGGRPRGAAIDTYDDHRIAMSFAVAGLATDGVVIKEPGCVAKSFPTFWRALDSLHPEGSATR